MYVPRNSDSRLTGPLNCWDKSQPPIKVVQVGLRRGRRAPKKLNDCLLLSRILLCTLMFFSCLYISHHLNKTMGSVRLGDKPRTAALRCARWSELTRLCQCCFVQIIGKIPAAKKYECKIKSYLEKRRSFKLFGARRQAPKFILGSYTSLQKSPVIRWAMNGDHKHIKTCKMSTLLEWSAKELFFLAEDSPSLLI